VGIDVGDGVGQGTATGVIGVGFLSQSGITVPGVVILARDNVGRR
jgi:hypothetical protein